MDIFRKISHSSVTSTVESTPSSSIRILRADSDSLESDRRFETEYISETDLLNNIDRLFPQRSRSKPSLSVIFFPDKRWKNIAGKAGPYHNAVRVFRSLRLDDALFAYLCSSRSGWYCVAGDEQYSFMIKDYLYMLAWTFNPITLETRAMIAARSDYEKRSSLKADDGSFDLPGLRAVHLYHPLSLACLSLIDFAFYFDKLIITEGYRIGKIEVNTGHGLWVKDEATQNIDLKKLMESSQEIARIIGIFANLFKSVQVTHTITESLQDERSWREWYENHGPNDEIMRNFNECAASFNAAISLLKLRIKTIKQSGLVMDARAKAQSNVIGNLIRREDARTGHGLAEATKKDSADMKVIAIMTMAFLPATFFAALFDIPTLQWDQPNVITRNFWVYWAFTVPTTFLVFFLWDILNERKLYSWLKSLLGIQKEEKKPSDEDLPRASSIELNHMPSGFIV
ncbi:hypothetical protein M426DRAFT_25342 [Hypoxylon sp. CI-4A]|nr:hypothetical protein M426DRAFT_25342 [Hypoxylon sp. CI-4A]